VPLTCTHVLDVPSHAHDQASIRKTIDQLSTPALIFRSWYSRSDLSLLYFYARINDGGYGGDGVVVFNWLVTHRGGCGILRWVDRKWTASGWLVVGDDAGVLELELG
jgi:hypothetical protein